MPDFPVPFITLPNWVNAAARCGFNIEPVFRELGIHTDLIHLESATIPQPVLERMLAACVRRARVGHFPFVLGETFAFDYLPDVETFLTTSPTLREAARVFDWVRELINPLIKLGLDERGDVAALVLNVPQDVLRAPGYKPYFSESVFAAAVKIGRRLLPPDTGLGRLTFTHPRPSYGAAYRRHFGLPVAFSQARNALEFDRALLDAPLSGGYPALHQQAEVRVEQRLGRLPRVTGLAAAVEEVLAQEPALLGQGVDAVAIRLGLRARTLQRRLCADGQRFAELQARVRYRLAIRELAQPGADLDRISERLGFSDRRSFTRAFRRWSGVTPSVFRRHAEGGETGSRGRRTD